MRGEKLHAAVAEFRVRVPHAARQFHEFSDVADEKRAVKAKLVAKLQRVADKIAGQDRRSGVDADGIPDKIRAVVPRRKKNILRAQFPPLPQLDADGVYKRLLAHGLDNASCAENRDAAHNAETGIERFFRKRLALRDGNDDGDSAIVAAEHADLADVFLDHPPGYGVDGRRADGLVEPALCDSANARAAVDQNPGRIRFPDAGKDERASGGVRVVSAVFSDGAGDFAGCYFDFLDRQMEPNPFRCEKVDGVLRPASQKHIGRRLCRSRCA